MRRIAKILSQHKRISVSIIERCGLDHTFYDDRVAIKFDPEVLHFLTCIVDIRNFKNGHAIALNGFDMFFQTNRQVIRVCRDF